MRAVFTLLKTSGHGARSTCVHASVNAVRREKMATTGRLRSRLGSGRALPSCDREGVGACTHFFTGFETKLREAVTRFSAASKARALCFFALASPKVSVVL